MLEKDGHRKFSLTVQRCIQSGNSLRFPLETFSSHCEMVFWFERSWKKKHGGIFFYFLFMARGEHQQSNRLRICKFLKLQGRLKKTKKKTSSSLWAHIETVPINQSGTCCSFQTKALQSCTVNYPEKKLSVSLLFTASHWGSNSSRARPSLEPGCGCGLLSYRWLNPRYSFYCELSQRAGDSLMSVHIG